MENRPPWATGCLLTAAHIFALICFTFMDLVARVTVHAQYLEFRGKIENLGNSEIACSHLQNTHQCHTELQAKRKPINSL